MTLTNSVDHREARSQLGRTNAPAEDQLAEAFDTIVSEGAQRLHRTWREVLATGLAGGLEVATGVLALLVAAGQPVQDAQAVAATGQRRDQPRVPGRSSRARCRRWTATSHCQSPASRSETANPVTTRGPVNTPSTS